MDDLVTFRRCARLCRSIYVETCLFHGSNFRRSGINCENCENWIPQKFPAISDAFTQIFGFYGEPAVEDRYLWPFCMSVDKRMGQIDDLVLLLYVRIYLTQSVAITQCLAHQNAINVRYLRYRHAILIRVVLHQQKDSSTWWAGSN